jgi:hypothetical protein
MPTIFTFAITIGNQQAGKKYTMSDADWSNLLQTYKTLVQNQNIGGSTPTNKDVLRLICDTAMNQINSIALQNAQQQAQQQAVSNVAAPTTTDEDLPITTVS